MYCQAVHVFADFADSAALMRRQQWAGVGLAQAPRAARATQAAAPRAQAHYSYLKVARVLGLGSDNLVAVPSDDSGAMLPAGLGACSNTLPLLTRGILHGACCVACWSGCLQALACVQVVAPCGL